MRMYLLECPACGAKIEIEPDRKSCFCTYCGNKIYLDDGTRRVEITKNINYHKTYTDEAKIRDIEFKERMFDKQIRADEEKSKRKEKSKFLNNTIPVLAILLALAVMWFYFDKSFDAEKQESDLQEAVLQETVEEIMNDIESGDFVSARVKAETLYYTENWSDDIEEKWDATRQELIKQIDAAEDAAEKAAKEAAREAKKAEKESNRESSGSWWNPFD